MTLGLRLAAYVLAHLLFWPPAIATGVVGRRLRYDSMPRLVLLMACFSAVMSLLIGSLLIYLHVDPSYGWHGLIRDTLDFAVVGAGSFILYRLVLGPRSKGIVMPGVPNNWNGP
jgi:hypothetical protein